MDELAGCLLGLFPAKVQTAIFVLAILGLVIFFGMVIYEEAGTQW